MSTSPRFTPPTAGLTIQQLVESPPKMLGVYDVQRRYICIVLGQKSPCPRCSHPMNWFEGHGLDPRTATYEDFEALGTDSVTRCKNPKCQVAIAHFLPWLGGGWYWRFISGQEAAGLAPAEGVAGA